MKGSEMLKVGKYNVRVVQVGENYGRNDCLVNDKAPMVEFYDARFDQSDWMGRGQFVSRYYVDTILDGNYPNGISLYGSEPAWTVSADEMRQVKQYLAGVAA
jgi:hypothetical protein